MSDVERMFRLLVRTLADVDPTWLHRPIPLGAMTREVIPYRDVRNRLNLACNEDYESLLIRLCAGQGGLAELTDTEAREHFAGRSESASRLGLTPPLVGDHRESRRASRGTGARRRTEGRVCTDTRTGQARRPSFSATRDASVRVGGPGPRPTRARLSVATRVIRPDPGQSGRPMPVLWW